MAWREITQSDVEGVLSSAELSAYESAVTAEGQSPMADAIAKVTDQCRGYIADNPANTLAVGATLPERAILPALHMIRVELLTRLDMEVSKDRAEAKRDAVRFFERVSDGKVNLEQPTGETDTESGGTPSIRVGSSRDRIAGRDSLAGL